MDWRFTSNFLLLLISTALSTRLAYYAWKRRPATGTTLFTLLMLAMAQWSLAYTLEITSVDLATKLIWAKFQYLGISLLPVAWLFFVLEFTGNESWITRRNVTLLALIPVSTFLLAVTNEAHGWIWQYTSLESTASRFPALHVEYGYWFWVHTIFSYGCLLVASAFLYSSWRRDLAALYRWQTIALLFGLVFPWAGNVLYITGVSPQDLTTFTFLMSGVALAHYTLRFRLFDIAPIAHRAIVTSMTDGILVLDAEGRVADANPAVQRIIGKHSTELIGEAFDTVWPNLFDDLAEAQKEPTEIKLDFKGSPRYYEVTVSSLHDWRKQARGHLIVLHEITRLKELDKMREHMTHTMVHDLRDPLSNSLFALEMLKGDLSDINLPESDQLLELTFAQTMKTLKLVDDILEIGRLKNGIEMVVTRTSVSLADLMDKVSSAHSTRLTDKQLHLLCDIPDLLPQAWADADLVERVLQNLVDNSINFSPVGATVKVSATPIRLNGSVEWSRLQISVSDEGPGIPSDFQEQIFDKFVAGTNRGSGIGLGLAFCKMALAAHGERIWVESKPGGGTTFTFTLPVSYAPVPLLSSS